MVTEGSIAHADEKFHPVRDDVVVDAVGAENRMGFTAIGDTVNVVFRLCSSEKEGEIVIEAISQVVPKKYDIGEDERLQGMGCEQPLVILEFRRIIFEFT